MTVPTEKDFDVAHRQWAPLLAQAMRLNIPLLVQMATKAIARGLSWAAFEYETRLPKGYLIALASGRRDIAHISDDTARAIAEFLDRPPIAVKAMAGQVRVEDFYSEADLAKQPEAMSILLRAPELAKEPASVAVFAGALARLESGRRRYLRDIVWDGPPGMH